MTGKRALRAKAGGRVILAAASALVVASCTSSGDPFERLGLMPQELAAAPSFTGGSSPSPASVKQDDVVAGEAFAASETAAGAADEQPAAEAATDDAAQRGDDALRARLYPQGEGSSAALAAAMAPAEEPRKKGLLAAFFGSPDASAQQPMPLAEQPAPAAEADAAPVDETDQGDAAVEQAETTPLEIAKAADAALNRPASTPAAAAPQQRGFLSSLFSSGPDRPATQRAAPERPMLALASTTGSTSSSARALYNTEALPGVRQGALFEIERRSSVDGDGDDDIDLYEGSGAYQVASAAGAAGLARLAPNGLLKQTDRVDVACLKPSLVRMLKTIESRFGQKVIVTSGYRSPPQNRSARGATNSLHMYCAAADIQVPGVDKWKLASFVRTMPGRGGVGTYCHTNSVHVDIGPERDWNWRCRRRR